MAEDMILFAVVAMLAIEINGDNFGLPLVPKDNPLGAAFQWLGKFCDCSFTISTAFSQLGFAGL